MKEIVVALFLVVFNDGSPTEVTAGIETDMMACATAITAARQLIKRGAVPSEVEGVYMECKRIRPMPVRAAKKHEDV